MAFDLSTNSAAKLEPFLLMAKSAKGAGAAKLVQDATGAQGVFVFGELLDMPNISQLEGTDHAQALALLRLFAYGTYDEYIKQKNSYPSLNQAQITKLRLLTLVSLSLSRRIIPYKLLLETLQISSIRELEDLIIDGIYMDILRGKLDQKAQQFDVEYAIGRDLTQSGVEILLASLQQWSKTTSTAINSLDSQLTKLATDRAADKKKLEDHEQQLQANLKEVSEKSTSGKSSGWPPTRTGTTKVSSAGLFGPSLSQSTNVDDLMEIDEPRAPPLSPQGDGKSKKPGSFKNTTTTEKPRKRNRF